MKAHGRKPPLSYFTKFAKQATGHSYEAEMKRFNGLEWLYLESRRRAMNLSPDEMAGMKREEHHWLIGFTPRPTNSKDGVLPQYGLPLHARRSLCVFLVQQGTIPAFKDRITVSVDPMVDDLTLTEVFLGVVKKAREKMFKRKRARGGGLPVPLAKMWQALLLYDEKKKSGNPLKLVSNLSEDGRERLHALAKRMIKVATAGQTAWQQNFPIH